MTSPKFLILKHFPKRKKWSLEHGTNDQITASKEVLGITLENFEGFKELVTNAKAEGVEVDLGKSIFGEYGRIWFNTKNEAISFANKHGYDVISENKVQRAYNVYRDAKSVIEILKTHGKVRIERLLGYRDGLDFLMNKGVVVVEDGFVELKEGGKQ